MIKVNELRIGNWVQVMGIYKDSYQKDGLISIDAEFILLVEQGKCGALPVPITPEILEKCAFDESLWQLNIIDENDNYKFDIGGIITGDLHSVHQLQNLYFALTNEELTVNL